MLIYAVRIPSRPAGVVDHVPRAMELHVQPTFTERVSVIGQPPPSMRRASQFLAPGRDRRPAGAHEGHIMMVSQLKRRPAPVSSLGNA